MFWRVLCFEFCLCGSRLYFLGHYLVRSRVRDDHKTKTTNRLGDIESISHVKYVPCFEKCETHQLGDLQLNQFTSFGWH